MLTKRTIPLLLLTMGALFSAAEVCRYTSPRASATLSLTGWIAFLVLFFLWLWEPTGPRAGIVDLARTGVLTCVAFGVRYLYYKRSGIVDAGIEVDAVYTMSPSSTSFISGNPSPSRG